MDEPASALDPIATQRIEELVYELKRDYTIVIVTHNMQQAARVSDVTAFFWLGRLVEAGPTAGAVHGPTREVDRRLRDGPIRLMTARHAPVAVWPLVVESLAVSRYHLWNATFRTFRKSSHC